MFIISLTYIVPVEEIETYLADHVKFLQKQYQKGYFILSGRKNPRTGGIIISTLEDKNTLLQTLEEDPFKQNNLAEYEITELIPTMTSEELSFLLQNQS